MMDIQSNNETMAYLSEDQLQTPKATKSCVTRVLSRRSSSRVRSNVMGLASPTPANSFLDDPLDSNDITLPFLKTYSVEDDRYSTMSSPKPQRPAYHGQTIAKYDASGTMNRLRNSMLGGERGDGTNGRSYTMTTMDTTESDTLSMSSNTMRYSNHVDSIEADKGKFSEIPVSSSSNKRRSSTCHWEEALGQVPSIALIAMFHLMIGIPFGVSYFPISWGAANEFVHNNGTVIDILNNNESGDNGPFPLPGKEAFGIRMFLFSTVVGQVVFTLMSGFGSPIGLQMVENVPFCQELSKIAISHQGWGIDALSTVIVMFGLASIVVGTVFYLLGRFKLGRIVYFFPTHVLIGCIGGIGLFLGKTGLEVTIADELSIESVQDNWHLLSVVLAFELILRALETAFQGAYPLLTPIYFCMIPPVFYCILIIMGYSMEEAEEAGYFFPPMDTDDAESENEKALLFTIINDPHLFDMWAAISLPSISWRAVLDSIPTLIALTLFSLIHVPINIPAFALSTDRDVDMNNELVAHGYANLIAGIGGGLQNYMAYTQSVLYSKSGGTGRLSGMAVAAATVVLFFIGPAIASLVPKCMAGTLLLHVGMDLFLEGVYDSYKKFDRLEYAGVWLIVIVMMVFGMEGAMLAGTIAAVSTYAVQSITYLNPIRGFMPAATLRSSCRDRPPEASKILDSLTAGRNRILVVQLQGHLFFGNMAQLTQSMHTLLTDEEHEDATGTGYDIPKFDEWLPPLIVVMDFSLVLSIDSSAAHAIGKLKNSILKKYPCELCVFVTPSHDGFPTAFDLSSELSKSPVDKYGRGISNKLGHPTDSPINEDTQLLLKQMMGHEGSRVIEKYSGSYVLHSLDEALIFAENAIVARADCSLVAECTANLSRHLVSGLSHLSQADEEREIVRRSLKNLCPVTIENEGFDQLFSLMQREVYSNGDYLWMQDSQSDCAKVLVNGSLIARLENEAGTTEGIRRGNLIGEFGLVNGDRRMSTVQCVSDEAILYNLSRASYEELVRTSPNVARYIDLTCVKYLAHRVQHVSNRIFETRCLPI